MTANVQMEGQRFGRLRVLRQNGVNAHQKKLWFCVCDCGGTTSVTTGGLNSGKTKSCGCERRKIVGFSEEHVKKMIGQHFGMLTVIDKGRLDAKNQRYWLCRCECGNTSMPWEQNLKGGLTLSCGCQRHKPSVTALNLVGQRFGKLTVIGSHAHRDCKHIWLCRCDCGNDTTVPTGALQSGNTKSCGCLRKERLIFSKQKKHEAFVRERVRYMTNRRFGKLTVIELVGADTSYHRRWACRCDCGNNSTVEEANLINGGTTSCGCQHLETRIRNIHDELVGKRVGKLLVLEEAARQEDGHLRWVCICDCGNKTELRTTPLRQGTTRSCGCLIAETMSEVKGTHRMTDTREYISWKSMKARCSNPGLDNFERYGGRGITVCDRWVDSFENFYEDLGPRPEGMTLDRKDPNGNYEPGNVRWATPETQANNRRLSARKYGTVKPSKDGGNQWNASMRFRGEVILNRTFTSSEEANEAYKQAEAFVREMIDNPVSEDDYSISSDDY